MAPVRLNAHYYQQFDADPARAVPGESYGGWKQAGVELAPEAARVGEEGIAENGAQLAALCRAHRVNHLVYVGFALNWCLLMSPGGMVDLRRRGCLCSTIREAVTAVENRETAREEREK